MPWLVAAISLAALGWLVAHALAYELLGLQPSSSGPGHNHQTGHGVALQHVHGYLPGIANIAGFAFVATLTIVFILSAARVSRADRTDGGAVTTGAFNPSRTMAGAVVVMPLLGFLAAELAEHHAAGIGLPNADLLVVGGVFQLIVGVLALLAVPRLVALFCVSGECVGRLIWLWVDQEQWARFRTRSQRACAHDRRDAFVALLIRAALYGSIGMRAPPTQQALTC